MNEDNPYCHVKPVFDGAKEFCEGFFMLLPVVVL